MIQCSSRQTDLDCITTTFIVQLRHHNGRDIYKTLHLDHQCDALHAGLQANIAGQGIDNTFHSQLVIPHATRATSAATGGVGVVILCQAGRLTSMQLTFEEVRHEGRLSTHAIEPTVELLSRCVIAHCSSANASVQCGVQTVH